MKLDHRQAGFSLLEMMVAIAVLAVALLAITSAQQSSINNAFRVQRGQAAALLMRAVVLDVEEEYRIDGFPENSITGRECEVPDDFDDMFECEYDLERFDLEPSEIQALVDQSFGGLMGDGGLQSMQGGDRSNMSSTLSGLIDGQGSSDSGMDLTGLAFLLPFLGPEGDALMSLCNVNLSMLLMGFMGVQAFVPQVLQEVSNRTRKLTARITWNEGPFGTREFVVTTFITALPEEQLKQLKEMEDARDLMEESGVQLPGTEAPVGGPRGAGPRGGAAGGTGYPGSTIPSGGGR